MHARITQELSQNNSMSKLYCRISGRSVVSDFFFLKILAWSWDWQPYVSIPVELLLKFWTITFKFVIFYQWIDWTSCGSQGKIREAEVKVSEKKELIIGIQLDAVAGEGICYTRLVLAWNHYKLATPAIGKESWIRTGSGTSWKLLGGRTGGNG